MREGVDVVEGLEAGDARAAFRGDRFELGGDAGGLFSDAGERVAEQVGRNLRGGGVQNRFPLAMARKRWIWPTLLRTGRAA